MGEAEELAGRAWSRLGGRGENQAVVFLYVKRPFISLVFALLSSLAFKR